VSARQIFSGECGMVRSTTIDLVFVSVDINSSQPVSY